jgi:hypothetical protein
MPRRDPRVTLREMLDAAKKARWFFRYARSRTVRDRGSLMPVKYYRTLEESEADRERYALEQLRARHEITAAFGHQSIPPRGVALPAA